MFQRVMLFALPLLVFVLTSVTLLTLDANRTPDWQIVLDNYLSATEPLEIDLRVEEAVKATLPLHFREGMGVAAINGQHWPWDIDRLPYPPDELYCVVVARIPIQSFDIQAKPEAQILFLGHFSDGLWRSGWHIHDGRSLLSPGVADDLAAIGCDLEQT